MHHLEGRGHRIGSRTATDLSPKIPALMDPLVRNQSLGFVGLYAIYWRSLLFLFPLILTLMPFLCIRVREINIYVHVCIKCLMCVCVCLYREGVDENSSASRHLGHSSYVHSPRLAAAAGVEAGHYSIQ